MSDKPPVLWHIKISHGRLGAAQGLGAAQALGADEGLTSAPTGGRPGKRRPRPSGQALLPSIAAESSRVRLATAPFRPVTTFRWTFGPHSGTNARRRDRRRRLDTRPRNQKPVPAAASSRTAGAGEACRDLALLGLGADLAPELLVDAIELVGVLGRERLTVRDARDLAQRLGIGRDRDVAVEPAGHDALGRAERDGVDRDLQPRRPRARPRSGRCPRSSCRRRAARSRRAGGASCASIRRRRCRAPSYSASPVAVPPEACRPSSVTASVSRSSVGRSTVCGESENPTSPTRSSFGTRSRNVCAALASRRRAASARRRSPPSSRTRR